MSEQLQTLAELEKTPTTHFLLQLGGLSRPHCNTDGLLTVCTILVQEEPESTDSQAPLALPNHGAPSTVLVTKGQERILSVPPHSENLDVCPANACSEAAWDWPVEAQGQPFQGNLWSIAGFLKLTVTQILCASPSGHAHSSWERRAFLRGYYLDATCHESPLASTFTAP